MIVDKFLIQKYASKNTSPKMPIEAKYVNAFLDSLLNSTWAEKKYDELDSQMRNGVSFLIFTSFYPTAKNVNEEPFRSITSYSMLKKDFTLFEMISAALFTGSVHEYHGRDLYAQIVRNTDETPIRYTDEGSYTDMGDGIIQIGFKNYYCEDPLPDGTGSEWQTIDELNDALWKFQNLITMVKPARIIVLLFSVPWCYLGGDKNELLSCEVDVDDERFSSPFGPEGGDSMEIIAGLTDAEKRNLYKRVEMYVYKEDETSETGYVKGKKDIEFDRTVYEYEDRIILEYNLKTERSNVGEESVTWGEITLTAEYGGTIYAATKVYDPDKDYYEKYDPFMLRINDDDPEGPCVALQVGGEQDKGAIFYRRTKA